MGAAIMGATMLDKNCIWYRQLVAENVYVEESGTALVQHQKPYPSTSIILCTVGK